MVEAGREEHVRIDLGDLQVKWLRTGMVKSNALYLHKHPEDQRRLTVVASAEEYNDY